jgi:hypothetical protein
MEKPCKHYRGHISDYIIIKLGQDACLSNCSALFDGADEGCRAILAILFIFILGYDLLENNAFGIHSTFTNS